MSDERKCECCEKGFRRRGFPWCTRCLSVVANNPSPVYSDIECIVCRKCPTHCTCTKCPTCGGSGKVAGPG